MQDEDKTTVVDFVQRLGYELYLTEPPSVTVEEAKSPEMSHSPNITSRL